MKKVAVIGAGIFGLSAALELSKFCEVHVYERNSEIISEATSQNMLRFHMGYHYPRSPATVEEIRRATPSFVSEFKDCLVFGFPAYYSVAKHDSMSTPDQVIEFCRKMKLPYEIVTPPDHVIDGSKIGLCINTPEGVYDPDILKQILQEKLDKSRVKVHLDHEVRGGRLVGDNKILRINEADMTFDVVVNATYSHFNTFNKWFGFETPVLQYDLMEILEIELPGIDRFGMLVLDGLFATILPKGKSDNYTLGHVRHTMLKRHVDSVMEPIHINRMTTTNKDKILDGAGYFMPAIKNAKYIRSLYSTRVIKPFHEHDDARPTEVNDLGKGLYTIFAGKVVTAVQAALELSEKVKKL